MTVTTQSPETTRRSEASAAAVSRNFLLILWQRKWLVLLGIVAGLAVGAIVCSQSKPVYRSNARVLVVKKRADVLPVATNSDIGNSTVDDFVSIHLSLLKSPLIVDRAIKKKKLNELPSLAGQDNPTSAIVASLTSTKEAATASSTVLNLNYDGASAEDTALILEALVDSYLDILDETYRSVSSNTVDLITKARDLLKKDLAEQQQEYRTFREKTPLLWKGKDGMNLHQVRMSEIETKKSGYLVRKAEIEGRLKAVEEAKKKGGNDLDLLLLPLPGSDKAELTPAVSRSSAVREVILELLEQEQLLLQELGKDHPSVRSLRSRIAAKQETVKILESTAPKPQVTPASGGTREERVARMIQELNQELSLLTISLESLNGLRGSEQKLAQELTHSELLDEQYRDNIVRTHQLYELTIKRLQEINLVRDLGGYEAKVIAPPALGAKVGPSLVRILLVALLLGTLVGIGFAYLAEVTDKSFHNPEEIRRRLGLPIMGHIPHSAIRQAASKANGTGITHTGMDPSLCVHHHPSSSEAEAFRGLRTALYFGAQGSDCKVIQMTSPSVSDGKTTLIANLAVSIAQSGKRVILVDADLRRPRLHKVFGLLDSKVGVTSVLIGETDLASAVRETEVPGLFLLPCGERPHNPAELLTSPQFDRMLAELRSQYDYVFVDTPPLLAVTDPCVVAARVDAVLLAIRISKNGRPAAERAKELLTSLGINLLGVIVNGVGRAAGSYGYRYYRYDYQYAYTAYTDRNEPHDAALRNGQTAAK